LALFLILILSDAESARATHDTQHRFTVYGQVRDEDGNPLQNTRVIVTDNRLEEEGGTTFTDPSGNYSQLLHLHNDNLGDEVVIRAGNREVRIKAVFNVEDRTTERKTRVDIGPSPQEVQKAKLWRYAGYGAAALFVIGGLMSLRLVLTRKPAP
jgi:hypothetical protein